MSSPLFLVQQEGTMTRMVTWRTGGPLAPPTGSWSCLSAWWTSTATSPGTWPTACTYDLSYPSSSPTGSFLSPLLLLFSYSILPPLPLTLYSPSHFRWIIAYLFFHLAAGRVANCISGIVWGSLNTECTVTNMYLFISLSLPLVKWEQHFGREHCRQWWDSSVISGTHTYIHAHSYHWPSLLHKPET